MKAVLLAVILGCALPTLGLAFSSVLPISSIFQPSRYCAALHKGYSHKSLLGQPGLKRGFKLRMSDDSTTVKEQCDGPAKVGEIGNVDVSAAKARNQEDEIPTEGVITLSDKAKKQLISLRKSRGDADLVLRVGVRSGGCRSFVGFRHSFCFMRKLLTK